MRKIDLRLDNSLKQLQIDLRLDNLFKQLQIEFAFG